MSVGTQATQQSINQNLSNDATALRNICETILNRQIFITSLGAPGLQAIGFTAVDANAIVQMYNYMNNIALVFMGTATVAAMFDFNNALASLYAGI